MSTLNERIQATAAALLASVEKNKISISADQRVSEVDAAALIGLSPGSLKNMRSERGAPPSYRAAVNGARISYRLYDLAVWIEARREDW